MNDDLKLMLKVIDRAIEEIEGREDVTLYQEGMTSGLKRARYLLGAWWPNNDLDRQELMRVWSVEKRRLHDGR